LFVLEKYCRRAFARPPTSSHVPPANVTASCDKVLKIRKQQAARRAALALIWYAYAMSLLVGFVGLQVYWRLPQRRNRGGFRSNTWLTRVAARMWHMLCPSALDYHPTTPKPASAGQSRPANCSWMVWLFNKALTVTPALGYCIDVVLDILTLVQLRNHADGLWALAKAYPMGGDYSTQLRLRGDHSNMLFCWLIIVIVGQYAAGILLTLPPTLAAYGVFDYQRLQFSWGCFALALFTGALGIFVGVFFFVGLWYILAADVYMLLAVVGVPARLLRGNQLNLPAYTTVRYLCEGILEALPAALISTAALNSQLLSEPATFRQLGVFWMSLLFSMLRITRELYKLACLTHDLGARCFSTAILDIIYHVQPQHGAGAAPAHVVQGQLGGGGAGTAKQRPANTNGKQAPVPTAGTSVDSAVVTAPLPDTGMTRDTTKGDPGSASAGAGLFASASMAQHSGSMVPSAAAVATAADTAAGVDGDDGLQPSSSTSKQRCGCCWRFRNCTEYPTVLAVYVYCCLGCLLVYLVLVCSDVAYPWLLAADKRTVYVCSPASRNGREVCSSYYTYTLPPFREQYSLLMMIEAWSKGSNAAYDCVLPSLICE
jgi:hypothetical protein